MSERHDLTDIVSQIVDDADEARPVVGTKLTDPRDVERPPRATEAAIPTSGGLDFDPTFASFGRRTLGLLIDFAALGVAVLPGVLIAVRGSVVSVVVGIAAALVGFTAVAFVAARSIASRRQFIGNRVTGTQVVDGINGSNLDTSRAFFRVVTRHLVSPILLFGFLTALPDHQRRTFHDRLVGSVVITRRREIWTNDDRSTSGDPPDTIPIVSINELPPPTGLATSPTASAEETVAIVAAMEALWPRPVVVAPSEDSPSRAWRFSGRWWSTPVPTRRARPFR